MLSSGAYKNINAMDAKELINQHKDLLILDVRTKSEYNDGHIPGAVLIPTNELAARIGEIMDYKDKPVLVYCASGGRSPGAVSFLAKNNFSQLYHLYRGFFSWNYEIER